MAEDYLAQVEWDANHPRDPNRGIPPVRYEPKWKYKRVYPKSYGASSASSKSCGIVVLLAIIAVAGYIIFSISTTTRVGVAAPIILVILLGVLFLVTREPK